MLGVGWPDRLRFSKQTGHDGRLGPAGDLRALTGRFVLRAWRHDADSQFQVVLQTLAEHIWRNPAYTYMSLPCWDLAPHLVAQFVVRSSWPNQLRLLHCAYPDVLLEDVQLRFDYETQTESARANAPYERDSPPCCAPSSTSVCYSSTTPRPQKHLRWRSTSPRALRTAPRRQSVSVGSLTALGEYLATRRTEVDRLRSEPAPKRAHAIEDAHRRATLDAAAAQTVLAPADGASADSAPSATKSAIRNWTVPGASVLFGRHALARQQGRRIRIWEPPNTHLGACISFYSL